MTVESTNKMMAVAAAAGMQRADIGATLGLLASRLAMLTAIASASEDIRNSKGTGHGREAEPKVPKHLAKMMLLTVCVHCEFLVRQYELICIEQSASES